MVTLNDIQKKIAEAIKTCGQTQTALSKQLNVSQSAIAHYIKGDIMPALDTFANLCIILDVEPADILCTDINKNKTMKDKCTCQAKRVKMH